MNKAGVKKDGPKTDNWQGRPGKGIVVGLAVFTGLLHFAVGPQYRGPWPVFVSGYLIDIMLPCSACLLLQFALRRHFPALSSLAFAATGVFLFGCMAETLQYFHIAFMGETFDPLDYGAYGLGVLTAVMIDRTIIRRLESASGRVFNPSPD